MWKCAECQVGDVYFVFDLAVIILYFLLQDNIGQMQADVTHTQAKCETFVFQCTDLHEVYKAQERNITSIIISLKLMLFF